MKKKFSDGDYFVVYNEYDDQVGTYPSYREATLKAKLQHADAYVVPIFSTTDDEIEEIEYD